MRHLPFPLIFLCAVGFALFTARIAHAFPAEVLSVHDGDSITARRVGPVRHKSDKVRVYGIDCPELDQPYGEEARELTARILDGKTVEIVPAQKGKSYRREVGGIVLLGDMLVIQDTLVSAGLAWVDDRFCKLPVCDLWRLHQREAKAARRGLWADDAPVPPWTWRKMKRPQRVK
ncbi:MAG: thermonuclease family protein [Desulfovibrio sp.]|uniref:thermonuclease family protein n=1 Tax=Desulfovibrio sp. TaxID=885 RepID=UPI001A6FB325|nr:thermonuclease family protein [Desulfovibrio sp.]MBD5417360.1 thermonuclease family protein [Desulfovibrio sp.]